MYPLCTLQKIQVDNTLWLVELGIELGWEVNHDIAAFNHVKFIYDGIREELQMHFRGGFEGVNLSSEQMLAGDAAEGLLLLLLDLVTNALRITH